MARYLVYPRLICSNETSGEALSLPQTCCLFVYIYTSLLTLVPSHLEPYNNFFFIQHLIHVLRMQYNFRFDLEGDGTYLDF